MAPQSINTWDEWDLGHQLGPLTIHFLCLGAKWGSTIIQCAEKGPRLDCMAELLSMGEVHYPTVQFQQENRILI